MKSDLEVSFEESAEKVFTLIKTATTPEKLTLREYIIIYMVGCYFYYVLDITMMSDRLFDGVCLYLKENLENIPENEWFRSYLHSDALAAVTGYQIKKYPHFISIVCNILKSQRRQWLV